MTVSVETILRIWESGQTQTPLERALQLVQAGWPEISPQKLAEFSIGQMDRHLLTLREQMFGSEISLLTDCDCGQRIDVSFDLSDVRTERAGETSSTIAVDFGQQEVQFRLPTCRDLLTLGCHADPATGTRILIRRCILSATKSERNNIADQLSDDQVDRVAAEMAAADPQANLQVPVECPECRRIWQAPFDIVSCLWSEISTWARRVLLEVRTLAGRYHWSERDILAMSPWRRQFYLGGEGT